MNKTDETATKTDSRGILVATARSGDLPKYNRTAE